VQRKERITLHRRRKERGGRLLVTKRKKKGGINFELNIKVKSGTERRAVKTFTVESGP